MGRAPRWRCLARPSRCGGAAPPWPRLRLANARSSAPRQRCPERLSRWSGVVPPSPLPLQAGVREQRASEALPLEAFAM
eukprot:5524467-Heterocapsa_arctica.AAC.1